MPVERHLILQELTLRPSGEWTPQSRTRDGWLVARVAEGVGYWMHGGNARELNVGDGFVAGFNAGVLLRSSQLGPLKLQFFSVQPHYLNGVLTVAEAHQLEAAPSSPLPQVSVFNAAEPVAQKFSRIADQPRGDSLLLRCALLQLWVSAVTGLMAAPVAGQSGGNKLHERFRQLVGRMTEAELAESLLPDIARQLHCSERHFSRLFREEFGVPFRARQIELRLQRAQQLLAGSEAKIINVAYESGYRHLGLFNAMFKKRFGVTPSEWRQSRGGGTPKNPPPPARNDFSKMTSALGLLLLGLGIFFSWPAGAQTNSAADTEAVARARAALLQKMAELDAAEKNAPALKAEQERNARIHVVQDSTNAGPRFQVERYLVSGNTLLTPEAIGDVMTNVPAAFGTNVSYPAIQAAVGDLQMAYREHGYVTVSVFPPAGQKLSSSNTTIRIQVIEAPLAAINVTGNRWFSTANVLRALPSLHTNMLLNSHVFQRELDQANASRDRQIYPVIGPGPEPRTSALTLKVKDTLPLHGRVELNNQNTPGTPELRVDSSVQYDNLWNFNHQLGLQYSFSPEQWKANDLFNKTPFDDPLVANYSGYYRLPLSGLRSVEQQVENNPASFGYNEVTHKFNLPPASGQAELNFYASRSTSETGVKNGASTNIVNNPPGLVIASQDSGDNLTLNEAIGGRLSVPLREFAGISSSVSLGLDYKHYRAASFNTNNFYATSIYQDTSGNSITNTAATHSGQPARYTSLYYLPLNIGFNGSIPDKLGVTFFNSTVNFNPFNILSGNGDFSRAAYTTNTGAHYVTVQMGVDRLQNLYKEWTVKLHADGQWANQPLFSNEQYAMGGSGSVRGYQNGEAYGDTGWHLTIEPQTPQVSIGMAGDEGSEVPVWVRGSVFLDYGELYAVGDVPAGYAHSANFCGTGFGATANIGNHFDARVSVAWPLISYGPTAAGNVHVYFAIGAQF